MGELIPGLSSNLFLIYTQIQQQKQQFTSIKITNPAPFKAPYKAVRSKKV